jgi:co-chaperonin GroES (HSP10)
MTQGNVLPTKLLVKKFIKPDKVTASGLVIPNTIIKEENSIVGDIVLCGEGTPTIPIPVKIGQRVIFNKHSCQSLTINEEPLLLLDIRDVLFYFTPENT